MKFDIFVLPFSVGFLILLIILFYKYFTWIKVLSSQEKKKIRKGLFSFKIFPVIKEIFTESLLHRRIFKVNPMLGYMHMSLAFGWFLLIVVGSVELNIFSQEKLKMFYEAIFFRFFYPDIEGARLHTTFVFIMDFLLLFVLTGVSLAYLKRFFSRLFGMKKATKHRPFDKIALTSLWLIFPLRLLAESFTSGIYNNGGFLTGSLGAFFAKYFILTDISYISWWAYSLSLGAFFVALPFSRYMHIPTEIILIALRKFGLYTDKEYTGFSEIEVNSCSSCGICIDKCQLSTSANINDVQSVYFIKSIRNNNIKNDVVYNCLLCGRCQEYCPVGVNTNSIRLSKRESFMINGNTSYEFINLPDIKKAKIAYFAGCMTHLTPGIKKSMKMIFEQAGENYTLLDDDGTVCCGRPLMLTGNYKQAEKLIEVNTQLIKNSNADILVTSCPICYKIFKEEYNLDIKILHHTEYLLSLVKENKINLIKSEQLFSYHDPCDLGRGSGVYDAPRELLQHIATLNKIDNEKENSLCCGGSLANLKISNEQKDTIRIDTLKILGKNNPDKIITSCPLCKKTLNINSEIQIEDIAETIAASIISSERKKTIEKEIPKNQLVEEGVFV
ncbi:MAG: (Fe-S)-binding protein [Bacteroidales bacterium]|nr:(Fe-S)-binding protein [Bacteroidales bacterium]